MLVLVATMMIVFLVAAVFSVDVAYMQLVRTELRAASDAAAKRAVEALTSEQDSDAAIAAAVEFAGRNTVAGRPLVLTDRDVVVGQGTLRDDGSWKFRAGREPANSVQVTARMADDTPNGAVNLFLGSILGRKTFELEQRSTAAHYEQEICLAIDRSHSMCFDLSGIDWRYPSGIPSYPRGYDYPPHSTRSRWASLEGAIDLFLDVTNTLEYRPDVALVTWGSRIENFHASDVDVPLGDDYNDIRRAIRSRGDHTMHGGTNMEAGLVEAIDVLTSGSAKPLAKKTIILMTDGQWNEGRNPQLVAQQARDAGIVIHTVTFLPGAAQYDMQRVAEITGGRHYHAENEEALLEAFRELALSLPIVLTE